MLAQRRPKEDDMLRHPTDGSQWRKVDRTYPEFVEDPRNIRFGLSTDGMNPFSEMSSSHSTWPVTILKNLGQLVFLYHDMMED